MGNLTYNEDTDRHKLNRSDNSPTQSFDAKYTLYVGIVIGGGILACLLIIAVILLHRKGIFKKFRASDRGSSTRRLFIRGFSTVTQRGAIDSTAEFEIVNTMSVSSEDDGCRNKHGSTSSKSEMVPKKPERRRRTSSSNAKYENVTLDVSTGFVVRKSVSMSSGIPFIDNTLDSRISEKDEDLDDVFH